MPEVVLGHLQGPKSAFCFLHGRAYDSRTNYIKTTSPSQMIPLKFRLNDHISKCRCSQVGVWNVFFLYKVASEEQFHIVVENLRFALLQTIGTDDKNDTEEETFLFKQLCLAASFWKKRHPSATHKTWQVAH